MIHASEKFDIFNMFAQNIHCGYMLEPVNIVPFL